MPASKRVGVSDIAKHAGVSIGTVSNYLNYPERVSDTLKEKIGASIKELGYTPRRNTLLPQRENAGPRLIGYIMTDIRLPRRRGRGTSGQHSHHPARPYQSPSRRSGVLRA